MKKISLRAISEILSGKELENVLGGSDFEVVITCGANYGQCWECDWYYNSYVEQGHCRRFT